jgi:kynurenine formamidase
MKIIDLSMEISADMAVFPGDPGVTLNLMLQFPEDVCQVTELRFGSHTGTHIDAPRHFLEQGSAIPDLPLDAFVGEAICLSPQIEAIGEKGIPVLDLSDEQRSLIRDHDRIILSTGWGKHSRKPEYFKEYPLFSESLLVFLLEKRPLLLGADLPTLMSESEPFLMHRKLFLQDTVFVEGLVNLKPLEGQRFLFSAAPLLLRDGDGSPVRAFAITDEDEMKIP